jgi:DNA uptake protein ComE-like DNA-binding protein
MKTGIKYKTSGNNGDREAVYSTFVKIFFLSFKSGQRGMVLVLTLWILAILSLLLLTISMAVNLSKEQAMSIKREFSADAVSRGAINALAKKLVDKHLELEKEKSKISSSATGKGIGHLELSMMRGRELGYYLVEPEKWKVTSYGEGSFPNSGEWLDKDYAVCEVTAEDSKAAVNQLKKDSWLNLSDFDKTRVAKIEKLMKDSGGKLLCVESLLTLKDLQGEIYDGGLGRKGLKEFLTTFSSGDLYINRASAPAIALMMDIKMKKAENIASRVKQGGYFTSLNKLGKEAGLSLGKLKSTVSLICKSYRIKSYAVVHGEIHKLEAVLTIGQKGEFQFTYMGSL